MFIRGFNYSPKTASCQLALILLFVLPNLTFATEQGPALGILLMGNPKVIAPTIVSISGTFNNSDEITIVSVPGMLRFCCAKIRSTALNKSTVVRLGTSAGQTLIEHRITWLPDRMAGGLAVAIKGNKKIVGRNKNEIFIDLNEDGLPEIIRSCASSDGIHISVWAGQLESLQRIWHAYYYVGQDLIPDCLPKDTHSS